jgi:hypothetical protein
MGLGSRPAPVFPLAAKLVRSSRLLGSELWAAAEGLDVGRPPIATSDRREWVFGEWLAKVCFYSEP